MRFREKFVAGLALATGTALCAQSPKAPMTVAQQKAFVQKYCMECHAPDIKSGGMDITKLDFAHPETTDDLAEKVMLRVGVSFMPPPRAEAHPDMAERMEFVQSLADGVDAYAANHPYYGNPILHRMNRSEYANSVRELLGVNVDADELLPTDTFDHGFDNMSDVLSITPTLMQAYIRAAGDISRQALGEAHALPGSTTYTVDRVVNQRNHVPGAPFGTRGGISVVHNFPSNGYYQFTVAMFYSLDGVLFGAEEGNTQKVEISVNGVPVALIPIVPTSTLYDILRTPPIYVPAGPQRISAAFPKTFDGPVDDSVQQVNFSLLDLNQAELPGLTTLPHLNTLTITGPSQASGVGETPSRKIIFSCYPKTAAQEEPCARQIIARLATKAFRRPVTGAEMTGLMNFYAMGHKDGGFESGIGAALQAVLASPSFIFRFERTRTRFIDAKFNVTAARTPWGAPEQVAYPISDLELASRLSYFLWSAAPDAELLKLAEANRLHEPEVLDAQVRRMLKDPRAMALSNNFASEWLHLQNLKSALPDGYLFHQYSQNLVNDMRTETLLFFNSIVQGDQSVLTLLNGNYTFVNADLAKLYGIPDVYGDRFRRVALTDPNRFGLLGKASLLTLTSSANRTSPTIRGKYIMEVFLGAPPPPPPPDVPALVTKGASGPQTVREALEQHRKNPFCAGCHAFMDPIGFSLENFNAIGEWRRFDDSLPIDASGKLFDGTPLNGPSDLRKALMAHSYSFLNTFTANLFAYGMGRVLVPQDMPQVRAIESYAAAHDNTFAAFAIGIVNSQPFRMRTEQVTPELKRLLATRMDLKKGAAVSSADHH
ncbi:MAG: DUF1592 domain-containing protein [Acidobacteriota bacterium]